MLVFEQRRQVLAACGSELEPARFDLKAGGGFPPGGRQDIVPGRPALLLNQAV